jgi:hypothetical protein
MGPLYFVLFSPEEEGEWTPSSGEFGPDVIALIDTCSKSTM